MYKKSFYRIPQLFAAVGATVILLAFLPQAAFAAVPTFSFTTIKVGESVTIQAVNFPQNTNFTVRMDIFGNLAIGGTIVGTVNSGTGNFNATFNIPASLKDKSTIAIRLDSTSDWYSYNWFTNKTNSTTVPPTTTYAGPYIEVIAVDANKEITVQAHGFPASQDFKIRVGPYYTFFTDYVVVGTVYSGSGGSFKFNVQLPAVVKDVYLATVRLDSPQKVYAYNAFRNVNTGSVSPQPTPLPVTGTTCTITSTTPTSTLQFYQDFDAAWTVKNTSSSNWEVSAVDYKYVSGTKMHKYASLYDLSQTVKPGETVKIIVDMLAPSQAGTYSVNWAIVQGSATLCNLPLTVVVK
jgi:hypothetical protein